MFEINYLFVVLAALIPMITGAIFYGPLFGKQWMNSLGYTQNNLPEPVKMPIVYVVSLVLSFILAFFLISLIEMTHKTCGETGEILFGSHDTFGHGALHGFFIGLGVAIPVLVNNLLFQRMKGSNILLNVAYWLITISLMGGVLDAWAA